MHLYNLTLQKGTAITCAAYGSFSAPKVQEVAVGRGRYLDLLRPDENGHLITVSSTEVFGTIRSLAAFRLAGTTRDFLVLGSDSGRLVVLEFQGPRRMWRKIQQETFGKTGCRRVVPGQYLACDPRGRAVMVAAIEKQKFVYVLNRDPTAALTISSPLEAHKSHGICFGICGVDVGFDNPVFASLEIDYSDLDDDPEAEDPQKVLVYYELDLGLNHVLRKWSTPVEATANLLIPVPGGNDGPSGVLVCSENYITYKHNSAPHVNEEGQSSNDKDLKVVIPRRQDMAPDSGLLIVAFAAHKQKDMFFFLVQSEYGDIYKVTLRYQEERVRKVEIKYFDTIPVANALVVMRAGFLFAASEFSNHRLYQFQGIGDDEDDGIIGYMTIGDEDTTEEEQEEFPLFRPRALKNLLLIDDIDSLSPLLDCKVLDLLREDTPQLYALCGRGPQSTLRILRHGLALSELAVSDLPGVPHAVWTTKKKFNDAYDDYIVVAFINATLVLSIGDTVEEVTDSGFLGNSSTLACGTLADDSMIQIHPFGIRHVRRDKRINEWKSTGKRSISRAALNPRQVVIAQGSEVVYFELDPSGGLVDIAKQDLGQEVLCLDVGPIPDGRQRSRFLVVGFPDKSVRLLSLEQDLAPMSRLVCTVEPSAVALVAMPGEAGEVLDNTYLFVGLSNGFLHRCTVDPSTGQIADQRTRLCGAKACKLIKVKAQGHSSVLALSTRTWLCYSVRHRFHLTPVGQDAFEHAAGFASEPCPEGLVTIQGNRVRILALERLGDSVFNQTVVRLKCTPRRFIKHPTHNYLILLETDHRTHTNQDKEEIRRELKATTRDEDDMDKDPEGEGDEEELPERDYGTIRAPAGTWASYLRIYDPLEATTHDMIELEDNQAAISLCTCVFHDTRGEPYLIVGTVKDLRPCPKQAKGGALLTFRFTDDGTKLELVHKTVVSGIPNALCSFQGRLLCGVDNVLRLYDLGRRKLLRKCENKNVPNTIVSIHKHGNRVYVGDITDSIHFLKYSKDQLVIFADTFTPRWITCLCPLDYRTLAAADKFGNVFVARLKEDVNDDLDLDTGGKNWMWERGYLNAAPQKADEILQFHVGDMVTSLSKTELTPGGQEVILYTTLLGSIGAMVPLQSRDDADFFQLLEMHLRQENPPLCGRDHLAYRSYYFPVKDVVDGDFCELFTTLPYSKQREIAEQLDRQPEDVCKRLEDMRNKVM